MTLVTAGVPPRPLFDRPKLELETEVTGSPKVTVHDRLDALVGLAAARTIVEAGAVASFVKVVVTAAEVLPAASLAVALAVSVPSPSRLALTPVTVAVPEPVVAGAVAVAELLAPFVSLTLTLSVFVELPSRPTETLTAEALLLLT